ncbi:galactose mutarotase [Aethina tumida]|uniref:galactose mutarotase n=1 Tax=Aethina tumida TaxID=116153 RepID=UPI0021473504|nr:galactose mutarotase [Aethina tumida]
MENQIIPAESEKVLTVVNDFLEKTDVKREESVATYISTEKKLYETKVITLTEDVFGVFMAENGSCQTVKRFTWTNHNKIQVSVINYGARIISIKMPDRNGKLEDIVLGFSDLAGYMFYAHQYFGATIGRVSDVIRHGTFVLDKKQYWLSQNMEGHNFNSGFDSIDRAVWSVYVKGKKVIMSHISPHLDNGFPGDLLIRVAFELSNKNEFNINMEAQTTSPTIVNLSNLTYFNLAGHHAGPDQIYKHVLALNCNCFTPKINDLPTGEILNVVYTNYDFQMPKVLGRRIGLRAKDGYNQNLCVNRGVEQDICFVARVLHPPSGRMLEVYSNQPGVNFSTANNFGFGERWNISQIMPKPKSQTKTPNELEEKLLLFAKIHEELFDSLKIDRMRNFEQLLNLIVKIEVNENVDRANSRLNLTKFEITPLQKNYLKSIYNFVSKEEYPSCRKLQDTIGKLLSVAHVINDDTPVTISTEDDTNKENRKIQNLKKKQEHINKVREKLKARLNHVPPWYKNPDHIIGKDGAKYKAHSGIALQSQNYPDAINFPNFPNCELNPGETYRHNITYKLWIKAGNPHKWMKRNFR